MIMRGNVPSRLTLRMLVGIGFLGLIVLPTWTMGQVNTTASDKTAPGDKDKQLQALEQRLQAIAKELQAQRKSASTSAKTEFKDVTVSDQSFLQRYFDSGTVAASDRDKKLQELETKVQALLKEVQALRGNKPAQPIQGILFADVDADGVIDLFVTNDTVQKPAEVTLSRTTYKLPAAKAEALGKFLEQHVKAVIMEVKVESDSLIVTTTPEVQRGVGQFIALIEGKSPQGQIRRGIFDQKPQERRPQAK
jgi:hypothetical protein